MSPRLRIYYNAVFGGLGGLLGWLLISLYVPALPGHIVVSDAVWGSVVGISIGGLLGIMDGLFLRSAFRVARGLLYGAGAGFVAGLVGLPLGEAALLVLGGGVGARAAGWSLFGLAIGMSEGLANRMPRKTSYGALGGTLGGALGGILFESLVRMVALQAFGRALGLVVLGACIGSLIGSVEEVLKKAWVKVVSGRSEGREYALLKPTMVIGRDERADIPLFADVALLPRHGEIRQSGNEHVLVPLASPASVNRQAVASAHVLRDGDVIRLGNTDLLYRLRGTVPTASALLIGLWLLATPFTVAAAPSARVSQVDKSQFPVVRVYVSVLDASGAPIEGLEIGDFELFEDGRRVPIAEFAGGKDAPIAIVLVIDRSGSMGDQGKMYAARGAAKTFLALLRRGDQVGLVAFSDRPQVLSGLTEDAAFVSTLLDQVYPGGGTAHYDGVVEGLKMTQPAVGRRAVVSLTDGMDNRSRSRLETALSISRDYSVPVYAIGLGSKGFIGRVGAGIDERPLQQLAAESGGQYFYAPDASALDALYRAILEQIQREYRLGYSTPRPELDGTRRTVVVRVRSSGQTAEARGPYLVAGVIGAARSQPGSLWPTLLILLLPLLGLLTMPSILHYLRAWPVRRSRTAGRPQWRLVPIGGGKDVPLTKNPVYIGLAQDDSIVTGDRGSSGVRAEIRNEGSMCVLRTVNGTVYVRAKGHADIEREVVQSVLQHGSVLRLGPWQYVVEFGDEHPAKTS